MRLNGVRPAYRADHIRLRELSDGTYRLYQLYIDLTGWDNRYPSSYGLVKETDANIARILDRDPSTISAYRHELLSKNLIRIDGGKVKVNDVEDRFLINPTQAQRRVKRGLEFENYDYLLGKIPPPRLENPITEEEHIPIPSEERTPEPLVSFSGDISNLHSGEGRRTMLIENGFSPTSLGEACPICHGNQPFIDCCAWDMYESLGGVTE